ncbi:MAG: hypothetical protein DRO06_04750 [Thermoproteota archaeon]|nr:MAG: hypothetical protein DRO06_04750 [Candidatus Korarchaeota archaeon]
MPDLWREVFLSYQRDPRLLREWAEEVAGDLDGALRRASSLVEAEERPDSMTLGFGPQVLVALASISEGGLRVITSPEVYEGTVPPTETSHRLLKLMEREGLVAAEVATMVPGPDLPPADVVLELEEVMSRIGARVLDVSGGTQLVPIAAVRAGIETLTYTYPHGDLVRVHTLRMGVRR